MKICANILMQIKNSSKNMFKHTFIMSGKTTAIRRTAVTGPN